MLNRKIPPQIRPVGQLALPDPRIVRLDNGIPVYVLDFPGQELVKIETVFDAGRLEEEKHTVSRAVSRLLRDGTELRPGAEVAEFFDYYGSSFTAPSGMDFSSFSLFTLKKFAPTVIPLYAEVIQKPLFPETELETFKRNSITELSVELTKVEVVAYRMITEMMFGADHPYGYNSVEADYQALARADLRAYYDKWYVPDNCKLFASGRVDEAMLEQLNTAFGAWKGGPRLENPAYPSAVATPGNAHFEQKSLQSAIKIGRRLFNKRHPDYNGMFVLTVLLGGYFGSRLMMNIREAKGYTYNIYATLDVYRYDGYFYIATEVNQDKRKATIREIFKEIKKLRETPVGEEELGMVRNYLLGMILNGLDGPMNVSDVVKGVIVENWGNDAYREFIDTIRTITPERLRDLANLYLREEDLWVVTVG